MTEAVKSAGISSRPVGTIEYSIARLVSHELADFETHLDLAGRITVLPVRTRPTTEQSPAALETNDADDTRIRSQQIPSLR
jgi:hypothetical protein